jgi:DNA-binding transcriptional LysR family regulator
VYAIYLPTRHLPAKIRAFIDYLLERFGPAPYWDLD